MWEDNKTRSKWVIVNQCYFPGDMPQTAGHPCSPDSNEVIVNALVGFFLYMSVNLNSENWCMSNKPMPMWLQLPVLISAVNANELEDTRKERQ